MAAQLTSNGDNKDKSAIYLAECRRMGIKVLPPCVNQSNLQFRAIGSDIRFGLGAVRNVGANVVDSIVKTRKAKGEYTSFSDFLDKSELVACNKRVLESLIKAGGFDSFDTTRLSMVKVHEDAVEAVVPLKRQEAMGQFDLFGFGGEEDGDAEVAASSSPLAHLKFEDEEYPRKQLLAYERDMLGLYVSAHPLDGAERILRQHAPKPIAALIDDAPKEGEVVLSGMISVVDRRVNKKGEPWAIVAVEDLDASMEVLFFAKSYSMWQTELVQDSAVAIKGRVNWRDDKMSVFGGNVITLDISDAERNPSEGPPPFVIRADAVKIDRDVVAELRGTLTAHRGDTPVHLVLAGSRETVFVLDNYSVNATASLAGELKGIRGISIGA
jgi:DNA polymerase-3 subunit alpha